MLNTNSLAIRESEFEQSKDSLLEEILPSSPESAASPDFRSRQSSPHRRNSYSQSFEADDGDLPTEETTAIAIQQASPSAATIPSPVEDTEANTLPPQETPEVVSTPVESRPVKTKKPKEKRDVVAAPAVVCNCAEREAAFTTAFEIERATLQGRIDALVQQLEAQTACSDQLKLQLEAQQASNTQLAQQLEARTAANAQLAQQLATAQNEKLQADQLAATSKDHAESCHHRVELLETEIRGLRDELTRSKRAIQDAELALARKTAEQDEVDQLERHREKRALEALSAQLQRALARLTLSQQVQEEGPGYDTSAARVAAEDEARLRVIASLEGSSKRAAQHAEEERAKLAELLRELEAGTRNARQAALEDKERLRQEQQRLDALSAHLQAQTAALRDQEAVHAAYMGQQLADAREDARVYEARLATRRTQLERDERALYEARAEFAAFREQTSLEIEREYEELRASRLRLEDAWRELRADREDLETELASHDDEFQALETLRHEVQSAEARLNERSQAVVELAEKLDAGTRELLAREELVAEQAALVENTDSSFADRERALERVKRDLEAREQRLHVQIRQLDSARGRLTQQRREQQQLLAAARKQYRSTTERPGNLPDNNKLWRSNPATPVGLDKSQRPSQQKSNWEIQQPEDDPSGLSPALRRQVEANWQRRDQHVSRRRQYDMNDFDAMAKMASCWPTKTSRETPSMKSSTAGVLKTTTSTAMHKPVQASHKSTEFQTRPPSRIPPPPVARMPPTQSSTTGFQPSLRINL